MYHLHCLIDVLENLNIWRWTALTLRVWEALAVRQAFFINQCNVCSSESFGSLMDVLEKGWSLLLHVISQNAHAGFSFFVKHVCLVGCPAACLYAPVAVQKSRCHGEESSDRGGVMWWDVPGLALSYRWDTGLPVVVRCIPALYLLASPSQG